MKKALSSYAYYSWLESMKDEIKALEKCDTCDLVDLPKARKSIICKWVFKNKFRVDGKLEWYKAWLVAKGYSQFEGVKFGEIFSPIYKITSIRFLLYIASTFDLELKKMDV